MPECISVEEYMREVKEDIDSPPTSNFVSKMGQCRQTVHDLEEGLDKDREGLSRMKKAVKNMHSTGQSFVVSGQELSDGLQRLSALGWRTDERQLSEACNKFSVVIREHSQLLQQLLTNQRNNLLSPLDSALKGELKGVKGDLKRPFDKAAKDYDTKFVKIEKERKQQAKEAGMIKSGVDPSEIAEDMSKERRLFQLQMCEYLLKVNEIKTKKGVEFLQKLVEYYHAYCKYFEEGLKTWEHFGSYVSVLSERLRAVRHRHEEERRLLMETRALIKSSLTTEDPGQVGGQGSAGYYLHQLSGNELDGTNKKGFLYKKSDSKVRRVWQKRLCEVRDSVLLIQHSDTSKPPVKVPLLTCQVKPHPDDKKCFHLVSYNRTYHLMGENEADTNVWVSVIRNSKEGALQKAFSEDRSGSISGMSGVGGGGGGGSEGAQPSFRELQQRITSYVLTLAGNTRCCDCSGTNDVTWLSTNYGIIVCIECSGIHRDLGVHISRIQSLTLDKVGTAQLLLARHMGNSAFNCIMEAANPSTKPEPTSTMEERREFIQSKYVRKAYVATNTGSGDTQQQLRDALQRNSLTDLVTAYMQGGDLTAPLTALGETALHVSIECNSSLHLVDFLVQNTGNLNNKTNEGNTALHYSVIHTRVECLRLLLRVGADPGPANTNNKTALAIAKERGERQMVHMLENPPSGQKKSLFDNVEYEWNLDDDNLTDMSDDDDGWRNGELPTPEKRSRPTSLPPPPPSTGSGDSSTAHHHHHSSHHHHHHGAGGAAPDSPHTQHRHHHSHGGHHHHSHHHHHHRNTVIASSSGALSSSAVPGHQKGGSSGEFARHPRPPDCQPPPPPPPAAPKPTSLSYISGSGSSSSSNFTGSLKKRPAPYPPPGTTVSSTSSHYATSGIARGGDANPYARPDPGSSNRRDSGLSMDRECSYGGGRDRETSDRRDSRDGLASSSSSSLQHGSNSSLYYHHDSPQQAGSDPSGGGGGGGYPDNNSSIYAKGGYGPGTGGGINISVGGGAANSGGGGKEYHSSGIVGSIGSSSRGSISSIGGGGGGAIDRDTSRGHKRSPSSDSSNSVFFIPDSSKAAAASTGSSLNDSLGGGVTGGNMSPASSAPSSPPPSMPGRPPPPSLNGGRSTDSLSSVLSDAGGGGLPQGGPPSKESGRPPPPPRTGAAAPRRRRCRALYDCAADLVDELSFCEGEIIVILEEETEDGDWMEGEVEGQPERRGKLPVNFVHMLGD